MVTRQSEALDKKVIWEVSYLAGHPMVARLFVNPTPSHLRVWPYCSELYPGPQARPGRQRREAECMMSEARANDACPAYAGMLHACVCAPPEYTDKIGFKKSGFQTR